SGADVSLPRITLPADGTYRVQVRAGHAGSKGHYNLTAWNATVLTQALTLDQIVTGQLDTSLRTDQWTFAAAQGDQIQFHLINASNPATGFDLSGEDGYTRPMLQNGDRVTLPATERYKVTVSIDPTNKLPGTYAFRIRRAAMPISLTPPMPYRGTLPGD